MTAEMKGRFFKFRDETIFPFINFAAILSVTLKEMCENTAKGQRAGVGGCERALEGKAVRIMLLNAEYN